MIASIIGGLTQLCILGAVIGLSLSTTALTNYPSSRLEIILSADERYYPSQSSLFVSQLESSKAVAVRKVYNQAYDLQMRIVMGVSVVSWCIGLCAFRKKPLSLEHAGLGKR